MTALEILLYGLLCGVLSVCYHLVLIADGHALSWFRRLLEDGAWLLQDRTEYGWPWKAYCWITKGLRECVWCLAGQLVILRWLAPSVFNILLEAGASIMTAYILFNMLKNRPHGQA